jgi:hypothetical protein
MKRFAALTGVVALIMAFGLAWADGHGHHDVPEHGHVLLLGVQFDGGDLVGFRTCVDLANGRALKNNAHHETIHTGNAGTTLRTRAGHVVVPTFAFDGCAELEAFFGK